MKKVLLASALLLPLTLTGCIVSVDGDGEYSHQSDWQDRENKNRRFISRLDTSTGIEEVRNRLGTPDFSELYERDGSEFRVLYYRTHKMDGDGLTTKDECTPIVFKDGMLVGWGETAYAAI